MRKSICLLLLHLCVATEAADTSLIDFEIGDQFGIVYRDEDWRGDLVLLIGTDQQGSAFDAAWKKAIIDAAAGLVEKNSFRVVHVADVRGVPFFLKAVVRGKFPQDKAHPVLLDWKGEFALAYRFAKAKANILVFDRQGQLKHQVSVEEVDEKKLNQIVELLATIPGHSAESRPN